MPESTQALYQAALGAYACFIFPANDEQRGYTVLACANIDEDYIERLARVLESGVADVEGARFIVAEGLLNNAHAHYHAHLSVNPPKEPTA